MALPPSLRLVRGNVTDLDGSLWASGLTKRAPDGAVRVAFLDSPLTAPQVTPAVGTTLAK